MLDSSCDEADGLKSSAGVAFRSMSLSLSSCEGPGPWLLKKASPDRRLRELLQVRMCSTG